MIGVIYLDFKQLNAFLTISKLQSFTKAADALGYAQSTITTQIKLLECELDVKLFERIGKTTTLTHEGKKLLPYAKQILNQLFLMKTNLQEHLLLELLNLYVFLDYLKSLKNISTFILMLMYH